MDIQTTQLILRPWQRSDDEEADHWPAYNDPFEPIWNISRPGEGGWSFGFESSQRRSWAVDDHSGRLMGRVSLREIDQRRGQARLGITFGAPYVSRGLGTEALRVFLFYFFTELGFSTMVLDVAAANLRAVRSYQRLGFSYIGSDWRLATSFFNPRVLDDPRYAPLRRHFRSTLRGTEVEFYEMRLTRVEWQATLG